MGTIFVVKNGLHFLVTRDILARYKVYRWYSYNGKSSYKMICYTTPPATTPLKTIVYFENQKFLGFMFVQCLFWGVCLL
jgi:hypothetical protein